MKELLLQLSQEMRKDMVFQISIENDKGDIRFRMIDTQARKQSGFTVVTPDLLKYGQPEIIDNWLKEKVTDLILQLNRITP